MTTVPKAVAPPVRLLATFQEERLDRTYDVRLLRRLGPFLRPQLVLLVGAILLSPIIAATSVISPLVLRSAIDTAVRHGSPDVIPRLAAVFLVALLADFGARFGQLYALQLAGQRAMVDLRAAVFRHVLSLRLAYFDRTPIGRVVTRATNDVDALGELFASGAVTAVSDVLILVAIVVAMLAVSWQLSLVAFAVFPVLAIVVEVFRRYAREAFRRIRALTAQLNAYLHEQVQGIAIVQAYGREPDCAADYDALNRSYRDANFQSIKYDALLYSVVESVAASCIALVLWYAAVRAGIVHEGARAGLYVGTVVAFYDYIQRFFGPIRDLSTKYNVVQQSLASAERIFSLLDTHEPDAPEGGARADRAVVPGEDPVVPAAIRFDHVGFGYRLGEPVLRDVSFDVKRGETIALVGATGAGKTTVASLLLRLYDVDEGAVLVGGRDVRAYDRAGLRGKFGVVPQDVFLFSGDVLENVALGDPKPDEARARLALERVGALELLDSRPGGLHAACTERGSNFSAGERQLLAFARALYRDPEIIVLDEATASVDSETEHRIQTALEQVLHGRTAVIVAHRLSTVRRADRILVFQKGRIAEQGTHDELVALDGVYARLHRLQATEVGSPAPASAAAELQRPT